MPKGKRPKVFASDCDGSEGASGSGVFLLGVKGRALIALLVSGSETTEQVNKAIETGKPNQRAFDATSWRTLNVPLAGKFYEVLAGALTE